MGAAALVRRHRADHRLDAANLLVVGLVLRQLLQVAHARQHPDNLLERPHLLDGLQLVAKILQRELVFPDFLFEPLRLFDVDGLLGTFDERQHVAHAQQPRHETIGIELLEIFEPLAAPDKRNRHADDRHDRQRRAAARIAIELAEHDARHAEPSIELAGALDRVLPRHRVGDVEQVGRLHGRPNRLELHHQLVVDVQAARRIDDDRIEAEIARFRHRAFCAPDRIHLSGGIVHANAGFLRDHVQLLNGRRTLHVGRHEQGMLPLPDQPLR